MSKIKICGLSRAADIDVVNRVLPDFIGFVFAPSRRRVDVKTAAMLKDKLDSRIKAVGVFVNEEIDFIANTYQNGVIDMVQLHGDEDCGYIKRLKESCGCSVIKAFGVGVGATVGVSLPPMPLEPDYLLFDTLSLERGGVGISFDWSILKGYNGLPYFLAGGLSVEKIADALNMLAPYCLDVSSGVETDGVKDAKKIEELVYLVRMLK